MKYSITLYCTSASNLAILTQVYNFIVVFYCYFELQILNTRDTKIL
jgi:lipoprotein NlpI